MAIFRRKPSMYEQMYQQKYRETYSRTRMREVMMAAKRDALAQARKDSLRPSVNTASIYGVVSSARSAAQQFTKNVDESNRRIGLDCMAPQRAYGKHAYTRRNVNGSQ